MAEKDEKAAEAKPEGGKAEGKAEKAGKPVLSAEQQAEASAKRAARAQGKGKGKGPAAAAARELANEKLRRPAPPRLRTLYNSELRAKLVKELGLKNTMEAPKMTSITVNMGLGEAVANPKILDSAVEELAMITGQQPV